MYTSWIEQLGGGVSAQCEIKSQPIANDVPGEADPTHLILAGIEIRLSRRAYYEDEQLGIDNMRAILSNAVEVIRELELVDKLCYTEQGLPLLEGASPHA